MFVEGGTTATIVALRRPDLVRGLVNHAGFDYFDRDAMEQQIQQEFRPLFGGRPDATEADPDAVEATFQAIPPMAATFNTMTAD